MPWAAYIRALKGGSAFREPGGTLESIRPNVVEIMLFYASELHEPIILAHSSSV
jgi:hypothetical protein